MAKDLVIVESPAKARTIERFLGDKYVAKASMGHVRDLPRREIGVEVDDGFTPKYQTLADKKKIVAELKAAAKDAKIVYLATDPDREGEAIAWHLIEAVKINANKIRRVVFHEITQNAVNEAFENPRGLDMDLINAQQARRVLDRLVGYDLSPVLWKKVRRGLSAGRVQSVALRLIVDRESEITAFIKEEYWSVEALLGRQAEGSKETVDAQLRSIKGEKGRLKIANGEEAGAITTDLGPAAYNVATVTKKEQKRRPSAPFITSTMQQEGVRKLRFTARRTMAVAQQLYEGVDIGGDGSEGLITYMRTDSTNVAATALSEANQYIKEKFGPNYASSKPRVFSKKSKGAQEAHEAIRPTSIYRDPATVRPHLTSEQFRLYDLIWKRMLASQMSDALLDMTTIDIEASGTPTGKVYEFRVTGSVLKFPGFRRLYLEGKDDAAESDDDESTLPNLNDGEALNSLSITPEQHFTQPPPRYTEATLVKALEEQGIGRPSTYAPTLATVTDRDYARKDQGRFVPTKLGTAVSGLLTAHFPDIMDVGFTARIEEQFDDVANGEREWVPVLKEFYGPFSESVTSALAEAERIPRDQIDEETDEVCEDCGRPMVIKSGRFGRFLSCSGFPECKASKPLLERVGVECPDCGNDLVERQGKGKGKGSGRKFYGCSNYPACTFAVSRRPLPQPCPDCGKLLLAAGKDNARCNTCDFNGPVPEDEAVELAS
jgi:DNA topoisomerase-1